MSIIGLVWARKGWPDALKRVYETARAEDQSIGHVPFMAAGKRSRCPADHTAIEPLDWQTRPAPERPRSAVGGRTAETEWHDIDIAYFRGFAGNYRTMARLFTMSGVETEERASWSDNGNERRRLQVKFPSIVATHWPEQVFHIDSNILVAGHAYSSQITAGVAAAHYLSDYEDFAGITMATKRRVYPRGPDGNANFDRLVLAIDSTDSGFCQRRNRAGDRY
jgi:hypothetical protein